MNTFCEVYRHGPVPSTHPGTHVALLGLHLEPCHVICSKPVSTSTDILQLGEDLVWKPLSKGRAQIIVSLQQDRDPLP